MHRWLLRQWRTWAGAVDGWMKWKRQRDGLRRVVLRQAVQRLENLTVLRCLRRGLSQWRRISQRVHNAVVTRVASANRVRWMLVQNLLRFKRSVWGRWLGETRSWHIGRSAALRTSRVLRRMMHYALFKGFRRWFIQAMAFRAEQLMGQQEEAARALLEQARGELKKQRRLSISERAGELMRARCMLLKVPLPC
jgi:hypothetical protein